MTKIEDFEFSFSGNPEYINVFNDEQSSSMEGAVLGTTCSFDNISSENCSVGTAGCIRDLNTDDCFDACIGDCAGELPCLDCGTDCTSDCTDVIACPSDTPIACPADSSCPKDEVCVDSCYYDVDATIYYAIGIVFHLSGHTNSTTSDVHRITKAGTFTFQEWETSHVCNVLSEGYSYQTVKYSNGVVYLTKYGISNTPSSFITTTTAGTTGYRCIGTVNIPGYNSETVTANTFYYANQTSNYQNPASITGRTGITTANLQMGNMSIMFSDKTTPSPLKFQIQKSNGNKYYAYVLQYGTNSFGGAGYLTIYSSSYTGNITISCIGVGDSTYGYTFPSSQTLAYSSGTSFIAGNNFYPSINTANPVVATFKMLTERFPSLNQSSNYVCLNNYTYGNGPSLILSDSVTNDSQLWKMSDIVRPSNSTAAYQLWGTEFNNYIVI